MQHKAATVVVEVPLPECADGEEEDNGLFDDLNELLSARALKQMLQGGASGLPVVHQGWQAAPASGAAEVAEDPDMANNANPALDATTQAKYCKICEMWLNGPTQYEDHKIGKKHKKNARGPRADNKKLGTPVAEADQIDDKGTEQDSDWQACHCWKKKDGWQKGWWTDSWKGSWQVKRRQKESRWRLSWWEDRRSEESRQEEGWQSGWGQDDS